MGAGSSGAGVRPAALAVVLALTALLGCSSYDREAGFGDVAFRLAWEGISDLDLFVEDPAGECIFFGLRESGTGGILDIDCNAGTGRLCERPVENVYWPTATAPPGSYRFWVHAHSLVPVEAPLEFQLRLLVGTRTAWSLTETIEAHDEVVGPFRYRVPAGEVEGPLPEAGRALPSCYRGDRVLGRSRG